MIEELINHLLLLAPRIANELVDGYWKSARTLTKNTREDITMELDHKIGRLVGRSIHRRFPKVQIDSEEAEERIGTGEVIVRLDPLDGSKHLVNGIDLISSSISISKKGKVLFGLVISPFSHKIYHAIKGKGSYLNGKKIQVNRESFTQSFIMHEEPTSKLFKQNPSLFKKYAKRLDKLMATGFRLRNVGLAPLSICWVAEGAACAYVDFSGTTKSYDTEAPSLIAREAGALIDHKGLIVANPVAYTEIINLFK